MNPNKMKPLRIFTAVWGAHLGWFEDALVRSLSWPKNAMALEGATWCFLTKQEHQDQIVSIVKKSGLKIRDIEFLILGPEFDMNPHAAGQFMKEGYLLEISKCITYNAQSLTAPPDTIFGDGSIWNMRQIASKRDVVVFAAHMRVLPGILNDTNEPTSNAKLVSLAMKHAHRTWIDAQESLGEINSYIGGVVWEHLDENLFAVTHRLPTPYLINFTPEDMVYFKNQIHYGIIDHDWPGECLIESERQRLVGSSDGAFMVELTHEQQNIPPVAPYREDEPDMFWRKKAHNKVNRMTRVILRGE